MMRRLLLALAFLTAAFPAFAVNPDEVLADPALEARARARCCSISASKPAMSTDQPCSRATSAVRSTGKP